jgi:hypothetical protein
MAFRDIKGKMANMPVTSSLVRNAAKAFRSTTMPTAETGRSLQQYQKILPRESRTSPDSAEEMTTAATEMRQPRCQWVHLKAHPSIPKPICAKSSKCSKRSGPGSTGASDSTMTYVRASMRGKRLSSYEYKFMITENLINYL